MFKKLLTFVMALALVFAFTLPAQAEYKNMWAYVYSWDGGYNADGTIKLTRQTSGIVYQVLQYNSDSEETLYVYNSSSTMDNPATTSDYAATTLSNKMVSFRVDPGETDDTYVDLIVTDTDGMYSYVYEGFDQYTHTIVIDERANVPHVGIIWWTYTSTTFLDTGIDFRYDTLINDTRVDVKYACPGCTLDVGFGDHHETGYDEDGLRDGVALDTLGFVSDTGIVTSTVSIEFYPDSTYGDLLYTIIAGTGAVSGGIEGAASVGDYAAYDMGGRTFLGHVVTGANATNLTYTKSSSVILGEGYIFIEHMRLR